MPNGYDLLIKEIHSYASSEKGQFLQRFFKTGPGEYGEGDVFLGLKVPVQRQLAKNYHRLLDKKDLKNLLESPFHEYRLIGLFILVLYYQKANIEEKGEWVDFYLRFKSSVNNWDLVDSSAPQILGDYLYDKDRSLLYELVSSSSLWDRRIAILSTQAFIRKGDFKDTLSLAKYLLQDKEDLIHKAVGWMLREVGKKDIETLYSFLFSYAQKMPRTMLRYAIEKCPPAKRAEFMKR